MKMCMVLEDLTCAVDDIPYIPSLLLDFFQSVFMCCVSFKPSSGLFRFCKSLLTVRTMKTLEK